MSFRDDDRRPPAADRETPGTPGLCGSCSHARVVRTRRGSAFWMCGLAESDSAYRRYPPLPVRACGGWTAGAPAGG